MKEYAHLKLEKKWQTYWEKKGIYHAQNASKKPKYYSLIEFPYPSGDGLHVGHPRPYIGMDVVSRKKRLEGYNVLYPIGWDAFGLPTENYAIKTGLDPRVVTKKNSENFKRQIKSLGISFDWSREINTTDPRYYKWPQWIFLQFLKKGLAYKAKIPINWCLSCKIGLANEEVVAGVCERCGGKVEKRDKEQWMLGITKYAERLDKDLDTVDYLSHIKLAQKNWIGKSEGAEISFKVSRMPLDIKVFTTRPDTIFGATFLAIAPEVAKKLTGKDFGIKVETEKENKPARNATHSVAGGEKIGKDTGLRAINPANKEEIPVWVVNYVSADYGTGAIMAVPADDERDREFAQKFSLPIVENYKKAGLEDFGKRKTTFKLRDWVFSRQRYWGEPIPVVFCEKCGTMPVPEKDLPVELPKVKNYQPTESGESPLANISKWVNVKCPKCKGKAKRETDTMPNWAGSSWYYLRYTDPKNNKAFADKKALKYWLGSDPAGGGVNWYNGGNEHTTLHLLYSRFWHKFLYDLKLVPTLEPYKKRTSHGLILAESGEKMSKSRGNVINPDDIVKRFGADTMRLYEMFMGPFDQAIAWSEDAIVGPRRFLERVWKLTSQVQRNSSTLLQSATGTFRLQNSPEPASQKHTSSTSKLLHKTIKKVSEDIDNMRFNTAISAMMMFVNEVEKNNFQLSTLHFKTFLQILSPFAPHIAEELWQILGEKKSINVSEWPKWDKKLVQDEEVKIAVQVNGKVRGEVIIQADDDEDMVKSKALMEKAVLKHVGGKEIKKSIYIPGRLINIVV